MKIQHTKGMYEKCTTHPKYRAIRRPRAKCHVCWAMWLAKNVFFQKYLLISDIEGIEAMLTVYGIPFEEITV